MVSCYPFRKTTWQGDHLVPQAVKLEDNEVVVFSWILYESRERRDEINAKVMADPRLADTMDPKNLPFDGKRMFWGGFKTIVEL